MFRLKTKSKYGGGNRSWRTTYKPHGIESLESRLLLASDWQNSRDLLNVNNDMPGIVDFDDVQPIVAELSESNFSDSVSGKLNSPNDAAAPPFVDVDGDGYVSPIDLVRVLNGLNHATPEPPCTLDEHGLQVFTVDDANAPVVGAPTSRYGAGHESFVGTLEPGRNRDILVGTGLLNGDLFPDVVTADGDRLLVYHGLPDGKLAEAQIVQLSNPGTALALGDFLGSREMDIAIGDDRGELTFLEGDGSGDFVMRSDHSGKRQRFSNSIVKSLRQFASAMKPQPCLQ